MKKNSIIFVTVLFLTARMFTASAMAASIESHLGVYLQELDDDDLESRFDYHDEGVVIVEVIEGTGAVKAGLKAGDIIMSFNGKDVSSLRKLKRLIRKTRPGDRALVKVFRDKAEMIITVVMSAKKRRPAYQWPEKWVHFAKSTRPWLGLHLQALTPQLADYFDVKAGILIKEVDKNGPADRAGLKAGDVIIAWGGRPVKKLRALYRQLDGSDVGEEIELTIVRKGAERKEKLLLAEPEDKHNHYFGLYLDEDDAGDVVFKMPAQGMQPWHHFQNNMDFMNEQMQMPADRIKEPYEESLQKLKEEMQGLRKELDEIKARKQ